MEFWKMHGLGNDFIFLDHFSLNSGAFNYPELARQLCHRQFGVGGDGLILVLPSAVAAARMRILIPMVQKRKCAATGSAVLPVLSLKRAIPGPIP